MRIKYLANCGLYIEYNGTHILVDALTEDQSLFDVLSKDVENAFIAGRDPGYQVDCLAYTHLHPDHYSEAKTRKFMEGHGSSILMMPGGGNVSKTIGKTTISFIKTGHITYDFPEHYCIDIKGEGCGILITADMELDRFDEMMAHIGKDEKRVLFMNPIFLGRSDWFSKVIGYDFEKIFVYHLPAKERDQYGYRQAAKQHYMKIKQYYQRIELLTEPMKEIVIT